MLSNNRRYDLSESLIHFFRDLDISQSGAPTTPEEWGYASIAEDWLMPAHFLLRHAVRQGRLWATWSTRGGKRTIYGPRPAVCFTEMPIAAFIEASRIRASKGENMSSYALVLPKRAIFRAGGRPVIYGLSGSDWPSGGDDGGMRSFAEQALPYPEQYRYVSFDPTKGTLDWSHEREWRWPLDDQPYEGDGSPADTSDDLPGMSLDHVSMRGLGVIVATELEAQRMVHDILTKVDRGDIKEDHYRFVLAHEAIPDWAELRGYEEMERAIDDNIITLDPYFGISAANAATLEAELDVLASNIEKAAPADTSGNYEVGGCWLWLADNRHPLVRALLHTKRIKISKSGKYLVDVDQIDRNRSLRQRETMMTDLAAQLTQNHGISATYMSVLNSQNPDGVPFYNGDLLDDRFFYNVNWEQRGATESTVD